MRFKVLIFSAFLCFAGVCFAPVFAVSPPDAVDGENPVTLTDDDSNNNSEVDAEEDPELNAANAVMDNEEDQEVLSLRDFLENMGWKDSDEDYRRDIFEKLDGLTDALHQNTQALEENYQNMEDKENSLENRMLGAAGIGTVGIGGMMAASALSEQNADKAAEQDMQAYLSTFSCSYPGGTAKGGQTGIELGGANQLIDLYTQYAELVADLKERKNALGLTPGIESEIVIDKAEAGLYDDTGTGIGSGAYASIARALRDPNGKDAQKWKEQKESTSKQLKIGAGVAIAGAVATAAANYAINHNNKDKSKELLAQRDKIQSDLSEILQFEMDECNAKIQAAKDLIENDSSNQDPEYVRIIKDLEFLVKPEDIYKLEGHPICQ